MDGWRDGIIDDVEKQGAAAPYRREDLIAICERAIVPIEKWRNRDSPSAQEQLGKALVLLRCGARFTVRRAPRHGEHGCYTDSRTIWVDIQWHGFSDFEFGTRWSESDTFYLPTRARLDAVNGEDWY